MQFSNTTNKQGVLQYCEKHTGLGYGNITGNSDVLLEFTANVNAAMRDLWHYIFTSTGVWEYDDSNQTNLPQATTDVVESQSKYALPSDALIIKRVELKDESGNWYKLHPLMRNDIPGAINEFHDEDGSPTYYRLLGDTLELFSPPNYDSTDGMRVYFSRGSVEFVSTDTTKVVGFASEYNDAVPLKASLEWLDINLPEDARTAKIQAKYDAKIIQLKEYFNRRFPAKKKILSPAYRSFK